MANTNQSLAAMFSQMADVYELLGADRFRTIAFRNASRTLSDMPEDVADLGADLKTLTAIDGIGKGTAQRILEFLETGKLKDHEKLMAQVPRGLLDLLEVPGLGPKTIAMMWNQAGVENLGDLKAKLNGDELSALPGLGRKKIENLRKSIAFAEQAGDRVHLGTAMALASWFVAELGKLAQVQRIEWAGSLRRGRETIGDLDLVVAAEAESARLITKKFLEFAPVTEVLVSGSTKSSVRTSEGIQVDLRIVGPESYGAALMYFTGSKEHNVAMRSRAINMGMRLNEYNLLKNGKPVAGASEKAIFEALGLAWIDPELRENRNEIALAENSSVPELVQVSDVKAELHAHTTASDGKWTIRELAASAAERGFHTVAVTDHSKGQAQANGLSNDRLEQHIADVRAVAQEMRHQISILAGSEVDILADGRLDYPNSLLKELDIVVASPHAALTQDAKKATARLVKAIDNPYVTIIGHATGRIILRREGLSPDMKQVIAAASDRGVALELNANTYRLDVRDVHARIAIEAGVKLAINTDAHGPADLDQLLYGVLTARRAGVTKTHVVNCMNREALAQWIASTR